jgi:hypothetical protein
MAHVVTDLDTTASPERVIAAITDFTPRRFDLWPNVDRRYFKLDKLDSSSADVTEGSPVFGGVWERSHYDWSRPGEVRIDVTDSNAFEPGSYWIYRVTPGKNGGSHVRMEFDRRPRNLKGRFVSGLLGLVGTRMFEQLLRKTLSKVETSPPA